MKKILAIIMLSILALFIITGCQSNKATSPATQTQTTVDAQNTAAITEADTTTKALDTTQVDKELGSAGTSLNNW